MRKRYFADVRKMSAKTSQVHLWCIALQPSAQERLFLIRISEEQNVCHMFIIRLSLVHIQVLLGEYDEAIGQNVKQFTAVFVCEASNCQVYGNDKTENATKKSNQGARVHFTKSDSVASSSTSNTRKSHTKSFLYACGKHMPKRVFDTTFATA